MNVTNTRRSFPWLINNIVGKLFGNKTKRSDPINEVLFYGFDNEEKRKRMGLDNLFCIYYVIMHTSTTIDVCVPSLVSNTIAKCLIEVQKRNKVRVRVIIHNSSDFHNLQSFAQNGIEVKVTSVAHRLEHEFILIDACEYEEGVAVIGSLDYDTNRLNCNRDTTILTSEGAVLKTLKKEFDRIWNQMELEHLSTVSNTTNN